MDKRPIDRIDADAGVKETIGDVKTSIVSGE